MEDSKTDDVNKEEDVAGEKDGSKEEDGSDKKDSDQAEELPSIAQTRILRAYKKVAIMFTAPPIDFNRVEDDLKVTEAEMNTVRDEHAESEKLMEKLRKEAAERTETLQAIKGKIDGGREKYYKYEANGPEFTRKNSAIRRSIINDVLPVNYRLAPDTEADEIEQVRVYLKAEIGTINEAEQFARASRTVGFTKPAIPPPVKDDESELLDFERGLL